MDKGKGDSSRHSSIYDYKSNACSCGGANERCASCQGRGFHRGSWGGPGESWSSPDSDAVPRCGTAVVGTRPVPRAALVEVCPKCSFRGTRDQVIAHQAQAHAPKLYRCPNCAFTGNRVDFDQHRESCRPARRRRGGKAKLRRGYRCLACSFRSPILVGIASHIATRHWPQDKNGGSVALCPVCSAKVKTGHALQHVRAVHRVRDSGEFPGAAFTPCLLPARPSRGRSESGDDDESSGDLGGPDRSDVTRPYAHAYRENGRFGSHPSHDGFGDESEP